MPGITSDHNTTLSWSVETTIVDSQPNNYEEPEHHIWSVVTAIVDSNMPGIT